MVDISSPLIQTHNTEDTLSYRDKLFYPASGWSYVMRRNMQEIVPGLFLGPYSCALEQFQNDLLEQGITHIVCVRDRSEAHFIYPQMNKNFTYLTLDIIDSEFESILKHIASVNGFIRKALNRRNKVLVHGNSGISRSASLVVAYVMETFNYSYVQALKLVKDKRGCIKPNPGFAAQLYEYEVIYKTYRYFEMAGQSSQPNLSRKRKSEESEPPVEIVDQIASSDNCHKSMKRMPNVKSKLEDWINS